MNDIESKLGARDSGPVETKVKAASFASYLAGVGLLAILNAATDVNLVGGLPDVLEAFVAPMIPTAATFIAGYLAKHTRRPGARTS